MADEHPSLREFVERIIEERDRLYDARLKSLDSFFTSSLLAMDKATQAAFASSEKAISKAENSQTDYNARSNEFRGQLDDQAKMLMPRAEMTNILRSYDSRLDRIDENISGLRESRSSGEGSSKTLFENRTQSNWNVGTLIAIVLGLISLMANFLRH